MADCSDLLIDATILVRGIRQNEIRDGKVKKSAFIPRKNGKDDDGLSVSELRSDARESLEERVKSSDGCYCKLSACDIRKKEQNFPGLDVCPSPTVMDPYHALIKGVPTGVSPAERGAATRLAELLADISVPL